MSDKRVHTARSNPRIEADKPAATVYGTGSVEATCPGCIDGDVPEWREVTKQWVHWPRGSIGIHPCYDRTNMPAPTPPASPTVTLTRETFDKLREAWATRSVNFEHNCVTLDFGAAEEIEALLRAAEKEQH